jgi:predicted metallo-beta-lactamase superfamily hydrolase
MIDQELTVEIVVEMYEQKILLLKKEIDRLNLELECKQIELLKERSNNNNNGEKIWQDGTTSTEETTIVSGTAK